MIDKQILIVRQNVLAHATNIVVNSPSQMKDTEDALFVIKHLAADLEKWVFREEKKEVSVPEIEVTL